jgi:hypothetical protein
MHLPREGRKGVLVPDRMNDMFERLVRVTQDYRSAGTAESEEALTSTLDEARTALGLADVAGNGSLMVRMLKEQVYITETVWRVRTKNASAPPVSNIDSRE